MIACTVAKLGGGPAALEALRAPAGSRRRSRRARPPRAARIHQGLRAPVAQVEVVADKRAERHQRDEDQPGVRVPVGEREVVREHREDDRQRQVVVVDRALLAARVPARVGLAARLLGPRRAPGAPG